MQGFSDCPQVSPEEWSQILEHNVDVSGESDSQNLFEEVHPAESRNIAARIREMQMQIGLMTREISGFMMPPAYVSQNGSISETREG